MSDHTEVRPDASFLFPEKFSKKSSTVKNVKHAHLKTIVFACKQFSILKRFPGLFNIFHGEVISGYHIKTQWITKLLQLITDKTFIVVLMLSLWIKFGILLHKIAV